MVGKDRILVVVAHPDDEVLGCGGTIARAVGLGCSVSLLVFTDGVGARGQKLEAITQRANEMKASTQVLGIENIKALAFPDNKLDSLALLDLVQEVETAIDCFMPTIIYTHYLHDLNQDHAKVAEAVRIATRPLPNMKVSRVLMMEVPSSLEWAFASRETFSPNYFVQLEEAEVEKKLLAFGEYESEIRTAPHPRRREHLKMLAGVRGSQCGSNWAEAFAVLRICQ
jgi:LmbE family N-acetylglucosaminyl deacetylase